MEQMISIPCGFVLDEPKDIEVGYMFTFTEDMNNKLAVVPCFRDLSWIMQDVGEYSYNYSDMYIYFGMSENYYGLPARGVVGPMGIEGSIEDGPLSMYDVRPYSCDITLPTNIRKLENCHLIAFLTDKQTEDIVNACTLPIQSLLGIGTPSADDADTDVVTRYNVAGQRIASPATGLQFLHHADGTVEKVMK